MVYHIAERSSKHEAATVSAGAAEAPGRAREWTAGQAPQPTPCQAPRLPQPTSSPGACPWPAPAILYRRGRRRTCGTAETPRTGSGRQPACPRCSRRGQATAWMQQGRARSRPAAMCTARTPARSQPTARGWQQRPRQRRQRRGRRACRRCRQTRRQAAAASSAAAGCASEAARGRAAAASRRVEGGVLGGRSSLLLLAQAQKRSPHCASSLNPLPEPSRVCCFPAGVQEAQQVQVRLAPAGHEPDLRGCGVRAARGARGEPPPGSRSQRAHAGRCRAAAGSRVQRADVPPRLPLASLQVDQVAAAVFGVTYIVVAVLIFTLQNGCERLLPRQRARQACLAPRSSLRRPLLLLLLTDASCISLCRHRAVCGA